MWCLQAATIRHGVLILNLSPIIESAELVSNERTNAFLSCNP
jgi:hypothetical protein